MIGKKTFSMEMIEEGIEEYLGFYTACGAGRDCCEPDATEYECDECGEFAVFGAEELIVMGRVY